MKTLFSIIICFFAFIPLAQAKKIKSPFINTVPVENDYLYAAQTEVSNIQYREFLSYIKKTKGMQEYYWSMQPDTNVWSKKLGLRDAFKGYYFQHPAYAEYPVVGISYYQAEQFCNWLELILSEELPKGIKKIKVRLPTEEEWEIAARGGHPDYNLPMGIDKYRKGEGDKNKDQGKNLYNYTIGKNTSPNTFYALENPGTITTPVKSYWPNEFGLYNMSGNVAEMVLNDTIVKGGSWSSSGYFLQIDKSDHGLNSHIPSSLVGFRYFIEVIEYDEQDHLIDSKVRTNWVKKSMTQIDSNLYACKNECTNISFRRFTMQYPQYAPKDSNWLLFGAKEYFKKYSWHADYYFYPVVNITHEAAVKYCDWLSQRYNSDPKRKYKKVLFRLPNAKEWENAANGKGTAKIFPWGGPYTRNSKGAFLANFNPIGTEYIKYDNNHLDLELINANYFKHGVDDGIKYTGFVESYFPNAFGLYNCSGNAAEMLELEGMSKGGSWGSTQDYLQIKSTVTMQTPYFYSRVYLPNSETSPFLGFRYFMEVIDY